MNAIKVLAVVALAVPICAATWLLIYGAIRVLRTKKAPRIEVEGSPAELIRTAYERTEFVA